MLMTHFCISSKLRIFWHRNHNFSDNKLKNKNYSLGKGTAKYAFLSVAMKIAVSMNWCTTPVSLS